MLNRPRSVGFTLVELLVAILIITVLISILIPTVSMVRIKGYETNTGALIQGLSGAMQQYQLAFGAYPGPLAEAQLGAPGATPRPTGIARGPTGNENAVLGLLGGLRRATAGTVIEFDQELVGKGPRSLAPNRPKTTTAFMSDVRDLSSGKYSDQAGSAQDSVVPEFIDRFPKPMPLLILRAAPGRTSAGTTPTDNPIITNGSVGHYDINQILGYTDYDGTLDAAYPPPPGDLFIGEGKKFTEYYANSGTPQKIAKAFHGLRTINTASKLTPGPGYYMPADAYAYFQSPSSPNTPRQKDSYIIISAGKDRVYGTEDDITNFGPVIPQR